MFDLRDVAYHGDARNVYARRDKGVSVHSFPHCFESRETSCKDGILSDSRNVCKLPLSIVVTTL